MVQDSLGSTFIQIVEAATGRPVRAFFSQVHENPEIAIELFFLEPAAETAEN
jgi:hypothetical protein